MEENVPRIAREPAPQGPVARTLGRWTAAQLTMPGVWSAVEASLAALKAEPGIRWDLRDLQRLDHLGAQALWNHWGHQWPAQLEVLPIKEPCWSGWPASRWCRHLIGGARCGNTFWAWASCCSS
jgi:hypothetical protein